MELKELLPLLNEWWRSGEITENKARSYRRLYYKDITTLMNNKQLIIITGLRRVGKTTLMYQGVEYLLSKGIRPENILYFSFDEEVEDIFEVLKEYRALTDVDWKDENIYVFLDEIQKYAGWSRGLKIIYDNYPKIKFVISGSASLNMEKEALVNLAGRYFFIDILPLTLREFTEMYLGKEITNMDIYFDDVEFAFSKFIKQPFPEIVKLDDDMRIIEYLRSIVIEKIIHVDIPGMVNSFRPQLATRLLEIFMREIGMILNVNSLSKDLSVSKSTLIEHIHYLEFARLIKLVRNFRPSVRAESRKLKRVYPYHAALALPFVYKLDKGKIYESLVRTYMGYDYYWRNGRNEVDFLDLVGEKIVPIEVKSTSAPRESTYGTMDRFMEKYNVDEGYLIYGGKKDHTKYRAGGKEIHLKPILKLLWDLKLY